MRALSVSSTVFRTFHMLCHLCVYPVQGVLYLCTLQTGTTCHALALYFQSFRVEWSKMLRSYSTFCRSNPFLSIKGLLLRIPYLSGSSLSHISHVANFYVWAIKLWQRANSYNVIHSPFVCNFWHVSKI